MTKIHEGKTDPGFSRPEDIVEALVCRKSGKLPTSGCYQDYRGSAVITELFAKGTVPTEKCTYHTSWGAMLVPENLRDLDTDDHYYSYKEPEEEEEDEDSERDSDSSEKNTKNKITISEQGPSKKKSAED